VWPYYELFLLGAPQTDSPWVRGAKFTYIRDKKGNIITDRHPDYEAICEADTGWNRWSTQTKKWVKAREKFPKMDWADFEEIWERDHPNDPRYVLVKKPHPRIFTYDGELWHHLGEYLKPDQIIARHGKWVKSSMEDYRGALEKDVHEARKWGFSLVAKYELYTPSAKSPFRNYDRDHLEVFIEKL
jgi:hypothetical protein